MTIIIEKQWNLFAIAFLISPLVRNPLIVPIEQFVHQYIECRNLI